MVNALNSKFNFYQFNSGRKYMLLFTILLTYYSWEITLATLVAYFFSLFLYFVILSAYQMWRDNKKPPKPPANKDNFFLDSFGVDFFAPAQVFFQFLNPFEENLSIDHLSLFECKTLILFSILLFFIAIYGMIYNFKNFLISMINVELMYLSLMSSLIFISRFTFDIKGQIFAIFSLIIAASESALGLGILIILFKFGKSIRFKAYTETRG